MTDPSRSPDPAVARGRSGAADQPLDTGPGSDGTAARRGGEQPADQRSWISGRVWVGVILATLILILLLVFIIQNNVTTQFQYFGWNFSLPLGVAMLLAAIAGFLVSGIIASVQITILKHRLKKSNRSLGDINRALGQ